VGERVGNSLDVGFKTAPTYSDGVTCLTTPQPPSVSVETESPLVERDAFPFPPQQQQH
jgi:hypothetical protein